MWACPPYFRSHLIVNIRLTKNHSHNEISATNHYEPLCYWTPLSLHYFKTRVIVCPMDRICHFDASGVCGQDCETLFVDRSSPNKFGTELIVPHQSPEYHIEEDFLSSLIRNCKMHMRDH